MHVCFFPIALMQTLLEDVESLKFKRREIKLAALSPSMIDYYISPMLLCLTRNLKNLNLNLIRKTDLAK